MQYQTESEGCSLMGGIFIFYRPTEINYVQKSLFFPGTLKKQKINKSANKKKQDAEAHTKSFLLFCVLKEKDGVTNFAVLLSSIKCFSSSPHLALPLLPHPGVRELKPKQSFKEVSVLALYLSGGQKC